jgi:hypothetical protein
MSQEYIASLVVIVSSVLAIFKIHLASEEVTAVVTGLAALWVIIRKIQKGEITPLGAVKR